MAKTGGLEGAKKGASMVVRGVFRPLGGNLVVPDVGRFRLPCHDKAGLCGGGLLWLRQNSAAMSCQRRLVRRRASMAAAWHCHPSYYENPTLHIGVR